MSEEVEAMPAHRRGRGETREWVGPPGGREDVTDLTDRELVLRAVNETMCTRYDLGRLAAEVGRLAEHVRRDEEDITVVKELRKDVRVWKRRSFAGLGAIVVGVLVIVIASYICARLGIRIVGG